MEDFFWACGRFDEIELEDLLLRNYTDMNYVLKMQGVDLIRLVKTAKEREEEEKFRQQWLTLFPYMNMKILEFIPCARYIENCTGKNIDTRPAQVVIQEILELHGMKEL